MISNDDKFTIRLKIGNNEIEISGKHDEVIDALQNVSHLVLETVQAFGQESSNITQNLQITENTATETFPSISIDPATPCPDAITQLLSTEWGRKEPRTLGELLAAMKVNAIHYPEGTVKGRLTDLTKRGVLRRISGSKGYEYILIKP